MLVYLLLIALWGLIIGAFARLALPGRDPMSIWMTMGIGVAGSLVAGLIANAVLNRGAGFLLSLIFAVGILYFIRRSRGGGLTSPGAPPLDR